MRKHLTTVHNMSKKDCDKALVIAEREDTKGAGLLLSAEKPLKSTKSKASPIEVSACSYTLLFLIFLYIYITYMYKSAVF